MKVLIIRFSAFGDLVLLSPVIRCLYQQIPGLEIHLLTKKKYAEATLASPYISKFYYYNNNSFELLQQLKMEDFDFVLDMHNNLRSFVFRNVVGGKKMALLKKYSWHKWKMVKSKKSNIKIPHIVDRYFEVAKLLNIKNDGLGLDFFIPKNEENVSKNLPEAFQTDFVSFAIGGSFATKRLPVQKIIEICDGISQPIILLGGPEDRVRAENILQGSKSLIFNACGLFSLIQSAALVKGSKVLITHDTSLMHIGAAFRVPMVSIWGNTIPDFGMTPYFPIHNVSKNYISQVTNLTCRPCSKLAFEACPKGHFQCMELQNVAEIINKTHEFSG